MLWKDGGRSKNLDDRRGLGGGGGMGRGLGIGGTAVLLVLSLLFGRNLFEEVPQTVTSQSDGALSPADSAREEPMVRFVSFVLDDAQAVWGKTLPQYGSQYQDAGLVLFRGATQTACGTGQSAMGPFYCPLDQKVYIDLEFFGDLQTKFAAAGDLAQAYVITHEIGHHVQHLLGTDAKVRAEQQRNPGAANELSVRMELQADCFAGVWAHSTEQRRMLQQGDVDEALTAAAAVGDDRIQQRSSGRVNPEAFTHGTAAQRSSWFKKGLSSGDPRICNTFG